MIKKRRRRAVTVAALVLALGAGGVWFHWQQTGLDPEVVTISDARLPEEFSGFRVTLVSDVHCAIFGEDNKALLAAVAEQRPDMIAVTGDLLDRFHTDFTMVEPLCSGLAAIAPTYYVTGNHEWGLGGKTVRGLKQVIAACGVTILSNEYKVLRRENASLVVAGIDDPNGYRDQKKLPELMSEIRADMGDPFVLLIAHRNDGELYAKCGVDVAVCGHAHGGLIRLPFTDGLISINRTLFPTWTSGAYQLEHGHLVVSRGLGNSGQTFRIFNRPHLPLLVLKR